MQTPWVAPVLLPIELVPQPQPLFVYSRTRQVQVPKGNNSDIRHCRNASASLGWGIANIFIISPVFRSSNLGDCCQPGCVSLRL